ncbi:hypothetical protein KP79_PYT01631 [Mizuhopecten yessoensis]|uniref:Uncharacterized protein n=1 Tax=Mizuhopecten yessoensis TaxID=6573 RepID=A0A210Q897_MIZYE|nr:hypothetical protein KP79_PYT01631 [Mizuhopecten yessoensis]
MEDGNNDVYIKFAEIAKERNEEEWQKKRDKYMEEGMSESEAERNADLKLKESNIQQCMDIYNKLLTYMLPVRHYNLHEKS